MFKSSSSIPKYFKLPSASFIVPEYCLLAKNGASKICLKSLSPESLSPAKIFWYSFVFGAAKTKWSFISGMYLHCFSTFVPTNPISRLPSFTRRIISKLSALVISTCVFTFFFKNPLNIVGTNHCAGTEDVPIRRNSLPFPPTSIIAFRCKSKISIAYL